MSDTQNVSSGKPAVGGAISVAPLGTALPTDATSQLDAAFKSLGYISEDGLINTNTPENEDIKAWGGDTVLSVLTGKPDTFGYKLIEGLKVDVLKFVYGDSNVTGTLESGITVRANANEMPEVVLVADMILKGGALKRIVVPLAKLTGLADITYRDNEAIGYEVTVTAFPYEFADDENDTHREYIIKPSGTTPPGGGE